MPRRFQIAVRLSGAEYQVLADWVARQEQPDPEVKLSISDAIRQAVRDLAAAEEKRSSDRKRRANGKPAKTSAREGG